MISNTLQQCWVWFGIPMTKLQLLFFMLAALTIMIIVGYFKYGDTRLLEVRPEAFRYFETNDQIQGGVSQSSLSFDNGITTLKCQIAKTDSYDWPYCGISIHIDESEAKGLDLSGFHTLWLDMDYVAKERDDATIRFYLRNFNPEYSTLEDEYTHKYNGIEFVPNLHNGPTAIPLNTLQVMTWWLHDNKIGIAHAGPEISNVNKIEIATGPGATLGEHTIVIRSLAFQGQYIAGESLFLGLLLFWLSFGGVYASVQVLDARRVIRAKTERESHLHDINIKLTEQHSEMVELAHRDSLTGALNRRGIESWISDHIERSELFSIMVIDIDRFKQVNDIWGHTTGDDVLREFAMVTRLNIDDKDKLVRWGGEEFVVFTPPYSDTKMQTKAEKIRLAIEGHTWVHKAKLTCSIGVAEMDNERVSEAIARADDALYKAKKGGRNRVVIAGRQQKIDQLIA